MNKYMVIAFATISIVGFQNCSKAPTSEPAKPEIAQDLKTGSLSKFQKAISGGGGDLQYIITNEGKGVYQIRVSLLEYKSVDLSFSISAATESIAQRLDGESDIIALMDGACSLEVEPEVVIPAGNETGTWGGYYATLMGHQEAFEIGKIIGCDDKVKLGRIDILVRSVVAKGSYLCTSSGSATSYSINASVTLGLVHTAKTGAYFVASLYKNDWYTYDGSAWTKIVENSNKTNLIEAFGDSDNVSEVHATEANDVNKKINSPTGFPTNSLANISKYALFTNLDVREYSGVQLFLGYGVGADLSTAFKEMLTQSRFDKCGSAIP